MLNADVNAARNIAAKLGHKTPTPRKIETYYPTSNRLTPDNGRDPHSADPALKGGEGVIFSTPS
ncbi:hypothetical protein [Pyrobaculum islandicum]|uniref:hypothetical protein n=1 Tax=Pyrobaculum islandicum TaxID=2277 RepID=UPI000B0BFF0C|nr:hypothetical protein [Pyrobaculum islandicum]